MKVLLLGFAKVKHMPYINLYLDNMREGNELHVVYWNRDGKDDILPDGITMHEFCCQQDDQVAKGSKIGSFIKYRRFVKRVVKKVQPDAIVALHTFPAVLLGGLLKRKYANRYIFDYRDSTYERFGPFKKLVARAVDNSYATCVSSDGFRRFLPATTKVLTTHNILRKDLVNRVDHKIPSDKIRVAFWGFIREASTNMAVVNALANDQRFELHFYGREGRVAHELKARAVELGANNVFFHGEYAPDDRYEFVKETDVILNAYAGANSRYAMTNKYYDGLMFRTPQVCATGTFMGTRAQERGVGTALSPTQADFADRLHEYVIGLDKGALAAACDAELQSVLAEYQKVEEMIKGFVKPN